MLVSPALEAPLSLVLVLVLAIAVARCYRSRWSCRRWCCCRRWCRHRSRWSCRCWCRSQSRSPRPTRRRSRPWGIVLCLACSCQGCWSRRRPGCCRDRCWSSSCPSRCHCLWLPESLELVSLPPPVLPLPPVAVSAVVGVATRCSRRRCRQCRHRSNPQGSCPRSRLVCPTSLGSAASSVDTVSQVVA